MSYKVLFFEGETVELSTKGRTGILSLKSDCLFIRTQPEVCITYDMLRSVELLRMHKMGRMLKVTHRDGAIFLTVIRFQLFGVFAVVNYFATGRLKQELDEIVNTIN